MGSIGEIDGVWGLNRDPPITRSHRRNREYGVRHGVEHSNDLTDSVVTRRDGYLFTIDVRDHNVKHCFSLIEYEQHMMEAIYVFELVGVDPFEHAVVSGPWMSME